MLTVHKIGGTSMTQFGDVVENIVIGQAENGNYYNRIFVVSAYSGVTNWLLEHKKTGEPGVYDLFRKGEGFAEALEELLKKLIGLNRNYESIGLDQLAADEFITERIQQSKNYLDSLAEVLASGYVSKSNILLAAREILASIGEAHSAYNSVLILRNRGINAYYRSLFSTSGYYCLTTRR